MAGMEELEIHSKSYLVRWIRVKEQHTISWSIQPHKKSLNFGIFKHPGHSAVLSANLPTSESDLNEGVVSSIGTTGTRPHASANAIEKLTSIGLKPIKWVGKCEADRICQGTYDVPPNEEGNYALVFDNTFSKQTSKTATLVLLTYPTDVPPQSGYHGIRHQPGAAPAPAPTTSTNNTSGPDSGTRGAGTLEVEESAESKNSRTRRRSLVTKNNNNAVGLSPNSGLSSVTSNTVHTGILQKRRRKRHQGWARRWFSLDFSSSTLSYYHDRNSSALRGAIPLSLAAVAANENSHEISVDSGAEIWHLRASNHQEFVSWKRALEKASKSPPAEDSQQTDGVHRIPSFHIVPDAVEQREWSKVEELAGIVSESREMVRRLAKDTDPKYLSPQALTPSERPRGRSPSPSRLSPSATETNGDDYFDSRDKRSFWKRKPSVNSRSSVRRSSASQQLTVPGQVSDSASITGDRKPGSVSSHTDSSDEVHDRLMAVFRNLDHVVAEYSTLLGERKRRRHSVGVPSQPRKSMESDVSQEFFDATDVASSPILTLQGDSDDESNTAKQAETVADDVPSDSSDDEEVETSPSNAPQHESASSLFPAKPKSLTPLPLSTAVKRRANITAPTVMPPSLIGFMRKNVGKDLSQISMPVSANEPLSLLQRAAEIMEYSDVLDKAACCSDPIERLMYVTAFAISPLSTNRVRERAIRKPFNPMLGETYELVREDRGFRFIAEKVSHRPVQLAYQAESKDWSLTQSPMPTQKFWGKSAEIVTEGMIRLVLHTTGEHFSWSAPASFLRNIIAGEKYVEPAGELLVHNETTGQRSVSTFKAGGMFSGRSEDVYSKSFDSYGQELPVGLNGTWATSLRLIKNGSLTNTTAWAAGQLVPDAPKHYGMTSFAAALNEITPIEEKKLPPTDSRLRPDQRALEDGDVDRAEEEKARLEEKQRSRRREMESAGETWIPRWFTRAEDAATAGDGTEVVWRLKSSKDGYWEERAKGSWTGVQPVFKL